MGRLVCPFCGDATSPTPWEFGGKISVGSDTTGWKKLVGVATAVSRSISGESTYGIMICQSCGKIFVAEDKRQGKGWVAIYPLRRGSVDENIPEPMKGEFEEAHLCFAV